MDYCIIFSTIFIIKKLNRGKFITRINLIIYRKFIIILLNDNLAIVKKILFKLNERMKKTNGNIWINANQKEYFLEYIFGYI